MSFLPQPITLQSLFGKVRKIDSIRVNVVISENTTDTLTITKQPVQQGASISDHAYKEPTILTMVAYFEDNIFTSLSELYDDLLELQISRVPFDVVTPKRIYENVLLASLTQTTDRSTENCLSVAMTFQEVVIVTVTTTQVPRLRQRIPGATGATQNAGKKSALRSAKEGIGGLFR